MHEAAHLDHALAHGLGGQVQVAQEALRHANEGRRGPAVEPVDGGAVDERGELAAADAQRVAHGGHAQDDVQLVSHARHEVGQAVVARLHHALGLAHGHHVAHDLVRLILRKKVRNLARVEHVVEVLEHGLVDDLRVGEEEDGVAALDAGAYHELFDVLAELSDAVAAVDLDGQARHTRHKGRHLGQRLLARAAYADEHGIAAGLAQDARDAGRVRQRILEEDEVHLRGEGDVVAVEQVVEDRGELGQVAHVLVELGVGVGLEEVCKHNGLGEELLKGHGHFEVAAAELHDELLEPRLVFLVDEAVVEDALALVHPQARKHVGGGTLARADHEHALKDLADVAQVEGVVELGGRGQQLLADLAIHLDGGAHHAAAHALHLGLELGRQEAAKDALEDERESRVRSGRNAHDVEVAREAGRHHGPTTAGGRGRHEEQHVGDVLPEELVAVVEALEVQKLSQQLDGRLCAVRFNRGHVYVVDEHHHLLARGRAQQVLPLLLQLALDTHLRHVRARLRREVHKNGNESHTPVVGHGLQAVEQRRNGHRLACARDARNEARLVHRDERAHNVAEAARVGGGHHQGEVRHIGVVSEGGDDLVPVAEARLLEVHEVVEGRVGPRQAQAGAQLLEQLTRVLPEGLPVAAGEGRAHGPDVAEEEDLEGERMERDERKRNVRNGEQVDERSTTD